MKIRHWMTPDPITVSTDTLLLDAQKLMSEKKIRRLPVVDKKGRLVGMITSRHILAATPSGATTLSVHEMYGLLGKLTVGEVMQKKVETVGPEDLVQEVVLRGHAEGIGAYPVIEDGKLIGIATESEIFNALVELIGPREGTSIIELANVELAKEVGATGRIASVIEKRGVPVEAIFTAPHRASAGNHVYIRARTSNKSGLQADLDAAGFKVVLN
ncbi:MAG: CBS and ACT domain-containing protein [Desulfarculaceae bacterium]|nr:CBS and ACT domain-containing protein [Desulfarculaceae bacterium]MCF8071287.1 CBS and ACT domain-containing protein [Desulfarculaceae bacterium]MCF8101612.1 CBS and ACT domain-containing protein [Desulfarculaceae bacterium]MCF8117448.1 CBS and ACT domain-containing protein [Desulfarculaceae bacterium]